MNHIPETELILNKDGSIYHLNLHPHEISDIVINVGDPDRVAMVSGFFGNIEVKKQKREFVTHTGNYKGRRITVISTGIGTDNIDIVYNELDALLNIDMKTREVRSSPKTINFVRLGTSGSLHADIPADSFVISKFGIGLDGLLNFYQLKNDAEELEILQAFEKQLPERGPFSKPYIAKGSAKLFELLKDDCTAGITCSCQGFYGPQGRHLRTPISKPELVKDLNSFKHGEHRITNFEMETGAMYGLAKIMEHHCCSVNLVVGNRITHQFSKNYQSKMKEMIEMMLERLILLS